MVRNTKKIEKCSSFLQVVLLQKSYVLYLNLHFYKTVIFCNKHKAEISMPFFINKQQPFLQAFTEIKMVKNILKLKNIGK